jgi:hypothetical protein
VTAADTTTDPVDTDADPVTADADPATTDTVTVVTDVADGEAATDEEAESPAPPPLRDRVRDVARSGLEPVWAVLLAALTFVVHDVARIIDQSYWLGEAWVADSTRAPLADAPQLTSSSPLGWTVALRLVIFGGPQRHRLLPLLLLAAAVLVAYLIGRRSPLPKPVGGTLAAVAVLLLPHALQRNDLKQYTADAFCALLLLWLTARAEERLTGSRLVDLAVAAPMTVLFSSTAILVSAAAFTGLATSILLRRQWANLVRLGIAALGAVAGAAAIYWSAIAPHVTAALTDHWREYFISFGDGVPAALDQFATRWSDAERLTNLGPPWLAAVILVAGLVTLARIRLLAVAISVPALAVALIGAAALERYPLLEQRTSFFFFVVLAVVAAFGLAGTARLLLEGGRLFGPTLAQVVGSTGGRRAGAVAGRVAAAGLVTAAAVAYSVVPITDYVRVTAIPEEDTRSATAWLRRNLGPDDVLVTSAGSAFGYAYYNPDHEPSFVRADLPNGFVPASDPAQPMIVVQPGTPATAPDYTRALTAAQSLLGPDGQIHVLQAHESFDNQRLGGVQIAAEHRWAGARVVVLARPSAVTGP